MHFIFIRTQRCRIFAYTPSETLGTMWLQKILAWLGHSPNQDHPTKEVAALACSVSLIRAVNEKTGKPNAGEVEKDHWKRSQFEAGRYVISDAHFKIGKHIRSVPRLQNISIEDILLARGTSLSEVSYISCS